MAMRSPIASAAGLPVSAPIFSWLPMTGNCASAVSTMRCWSDGSPSSAKPRIVVPTSSSGKSEKKP
jgi:hypothetical protein